MFSEVLFFLVQNVLSVFTWSLVYALDDPLNNDGIADLKQWLRALPPNWRKFYIHIGKQYIAPIHTHHSLHVPLSHCTPLRTKQLPANTPPPPSTAVHPNIPTLQNAQHTALAPMTPTATLQRVTSSPATKGIVGLPFAASPGMSWRS